ncbi:hypothetical protein O0L34_g7405 [Tuta absoluta]|nr:hypothetical protein O0L34_g7405 [Tuta absoluta]
MFSRIVLLVSIFAFAKCVQMDVAFTQVSTTLFGVPCLNDCIDGKCYTDHDSVKDNIRKSCVVREETAPTYYTSQTQAKPTCLSRCGKYGYDYEWCYVSNDRSWDFCNSEISISWVKNQYQSLYYGPCADSCEFDGTNYSCNNYHKNRVVCDPNYKDNFVQARTKFGDKCLDRCKKHQGKLHNNYYCEDMNFGTITCAPPAKPPPMTEYYKKLPSSDCVQGSKKTKRCVKDINFSAVIETANKIEKSKYFKTETVNEARNPVYTYTVKPAMSEGDPVLPLVIRAKITADTIKPVRQFKSRLHSSEGTHRGKIIPRDKSSMPLDVTENLDRMAKLPKDKPRKLIGYYLGGLSTVYNTVPLRRSVRSMTQKFEEEIYFWLRRRNTTVDVTIVVMYGNHSRPDALAVDIVFRKGDKIVRMHRDKILANIGPRQEENIIEPVKRTTTVRPEDRDEEYIIDVLQG